MMDNIKPLVAFVAGVLAVTAAWADDAAPPAVTPQRLQLWSYQPVHPPDIPVVHDKKWVRTPIDAFVLAKLESKGWRRRQRRIELRSRGA